MKLSNYIFAFAGAILLVVSLIGFLDSSNDTIEIGQDKPDGFFDYYRNITVPFGQEHSGYRPNYAIEEFNKALKKKPVKLKSTEASFNWVQRGPGNVGGRTRTVIIDPDDATGNTWFAGSVSGGIWKTTNGGESWENLTPLLPNLSTAALAFAPSNTPVIYAGTGEGYGGEGMVSGNGIFVSVNKGQSWELMPSTTADDRFRFVNKIWVDPADDSILVVATNKGIFKSFDGGQNWAEPYTVGYAIQDIVQNPLNPNVLYAGANSLGVLKSTDRGNSWHNSSNGFTECYRVSLSVSPADTSCIFAGVEAPGQQTHVYRSTDGGNSWALNYNADGLFINFHRQQGWFNNVVAAHPFERDKVYVAGVYMGLLQFKRFSYTSSPGIVRVDTVGTGSHMRFTGFGGSAFRGAVATGLDEEANVEEDDFVTVEIRFGKGLLQKAHRFTVPEGEGAGVPPEDYTYQDYVDVPFEVWDLDNNRQLMVSFRDQDRNGKFNLSERYYNDNVSGREYIFISGYSYDSTKPNIDLAQQGGYEQKLLYFIWPYLPEDEEWVPDSLPDSKIKILFGTISFQEAYTTILADDRLNEDLHVDHHDMKFFVTNEEKQEFNIVDANDGGLGFSDDQGKTWKQINKGYLTTQFYGMAKRPGKHEYIGGMQDNGTWQSPVNSSASSSSEYSFKIEGDGFETLWHPWYPQRILGSSYSNYIKISNDYGETWEWTINGMNGDGPFITKLSHSRENPNLVFAVGSQGLYKHVNFGMGRYNWQIVDLGDNWAIDNYVNSSHHVEVSLANPEVVYAGGGMFKKPDLNLFVSTDYGETFDTMSTFMGVELGYISGLATHPTNPAEAFVLFSYRAKPKVLRTMDYGQTWEELSGFGTDSTSSNGFPDVIVNDLLVLPNDTNTIWVGTEIGLFESNDNGVSWHFANNGLPHVSIWQLDVFENVLMVATHGRGIWTSTLGDVNKVIENEGGVVSKIYPNPAIDQFNLKIDAPYLGDVVVSIYSLDGKQLRSYLLNKNTSAFNYNFDISYLKMGTYIVSLNLGSEQTALKLVVQ